MMKDVSNRRKRFLLVLPTSTYRAGAFMQAASQIDADVVVATDHRQALAGVVPDTTLALNFRKPDEIERKVKEFASRLPLDAVIGVDDASALLAARIAAALDLPGNPPGAVSAARDKYRMRERLAAFGLPTPRYTRIPVSDSPEEAADGLEYPGVLKPLFLSASRGVVRFDNPTEFQARFRELTALLKTDDVRERAEAGENEYLLAESYIDGAEVALEGILINGRLKTLAIFDKPDPLAGPYFVETIYTTPSRLPAYVQREVIHTARQAVLAIGLKRGPVHVEIRVNESGAWVVEIAARSIGGLCSRVLRFEEGVSLEQLILTDALGGDVTACQREHLAAGVMMMNAGSSGILESVSGTEAATGMPGIEEIAITVPAGQPVSPIEVGGKYLGFIFARATLPEEVEALLRSAHQQLTVRIRSEVS